MNMQACLLETWYQIMMKNEKERLFCWSEESIQWYKNAAENETYHQNLAKYILKVLPDKPTICDMGCGVGYLSLALAPYAESIFSVDLNEKAIHVLNENITKQNISNISTLVGDLELLSPLKQPFDAIVMCLFGGLTELIKKAQGWTTNKLIYIMPINSKRTFAATKEKTNGDSIEEIIEFLKDNNYKFEIENITLPFGQPLESFEEAVKFIRHYDRKSTDEAIEIYLKEKLIDYNNLDYPLYFPNEKKLAMFIIEKN